MPFCPSATKYDNRLLIMIPNPDAKFAYGSICVKKCPGRLSGFFAYNSEMITTISHANCFLLNMFCI